MEEELKLNSETKVLRFNGIKKFMSFIMRCEEPIRINKNKVFNEDNFLIAVYNKNTIQDGDN